MSSLALGPRSPKSGTFSTHLRHYKMPVHRCDFFACCKRSDSNTPFQADRIGHDIAMRLLVAGICLPYHQPEFLGINGL